MVRGCGLWLVLFASSFVVASPLTAEQTPEESNQFAYEQLQGQTAGKGHLSTPAIAGQYGRKSPPKDMAAPMQTSPREPAVTKGGPRRGVSEIRPVSFNKQNPVLGGVADKGWRGVVAISLIGLALGGGFGYMTGKWGQKPDEEA